MIQYIAKGGANMLSYLELTNFKSFSKINLDLRGAHGIPKKMAFIYGENGSGKSNLISALLFLSKSLSTLRNQERMKKLTEPRVSKLLSEIRDDGMRQDVISHLIQLQFFTLEDIIGECKTLQNKEPMSVTIGFYLDGKHGTYSLIFDESNVIFEELKFQIRERMGTMFSITNKKTDLSPTIFVDSDYKNELLMDIEKFWGKHTFMSILFNEIETKNFKYVNTRIKENLFVVLNWLNKFSVMCTHSQGQTAQVAVSFHFLQNLEGGTIKDKNDKELRTFEAALNTFFVQLYSDIKGVFYQITPSEDEYEYELYFKKKINDKIIDVPIHLESTGTQKLLNIFPFLFSAMVGESVFIDEIDSGIHDLLMCEIIEYLKDSIKGQFVTTTHNTLLMKRLPSENVYIISSDANANKEIVCIKDYGFRTQKNNNIQNKYLEGDYAGIPYTGYLDLEEMVNDVINNLSPDTDFK